MVVVAAGGGGDDDDEGATFMVLLLWDKLGKPWGEHGEEDVRGDGTKPWISIRMCSIFSVHVGSEVLKFWRSLFGFISFSCLMTRLQSQEFREGRVSGWLDASIGPRYQLAIELATRVLHSFACWPLKFR